MENSGESPLTAALSHLRKGDTSIATFQDPEGRVFPRSNTTKVDIFEVKNGRGIVYRDLDDDEFRKNMKDDSVDLQHTRRLRIIMLDGDEDDAERLPIAPSTLKLVLDTYKIAPRFAFYLSRQQMASGSTHFDDSTQEPVRHELWYSAVVRAPANDTLRPEQDNSRRVMNWLRTVIWADFDARTGNSTVLVFRYPVGMKEAFFAEFEGKKGAVLEVHPMIFHAHCLERLCTHTRDVNKWFFEPLYNFEQQTIGLKTPADLFSSARSLRGVYRQIRQVLSDYEIFLSTAKSLRKHNATFATLLSKYSESESRSIADSENNPKGSEREGLKASSLELQLQLDISFQQVRKELKLGKVYLTLYLERCTSGIQDTEALSSRYSAEIQLKTSREFTQISRDSTEDNKSLKTIQILTAIFLPPSLISSIFGMGFFSTDIAQEGFIDKPVVFSVASNWWWYIAITLPVTACVLLFISREWIRWHPEEKQLVWRRRSSVRSSDIEQVLKASSST
ncbi:hypothetical protein VTL71DRAFT_14330 [Oculimacula yallundae]|uniref:Uncharacterized protein n=1 Tax=Oculimacula yallundae TaxID=86028 RepID=A0ABR4CJI2_9HELO